MLLVPLLALVGIGLFLLARSRAAEGAEAALARRLLDLALRDPPEARRLLREHPELLAARYAHDQTALHLCAIEGSADGVRLFATAGVPIDAVNRLGDTALVEAAALGRVEIVKLLLRHGASPNAVSPLRGHVLRVADAHGHAEVVALLRDAGARAGEVTAVAPSR